MNHTRTVPATPLVRHPRTALAAVAALALALPLAAAATGDRADAATPASERPASVVGLADGDTLVSFFANAPQRANRIAQVTGLTGDTSIIGMDFRAADRKLYAVGNLGGLYTIVTATGVATKVGQLTVALDGTHFGVDFNPAADRLRIVSDTGQNLRHNPNAGGTTIADTALNTPPTAGTTTGIVAAAYTNNDNDAATGTTLFDLDANLDQFVVQSPANSGQLAVTGKMTQVTTPEAGLDIYTVTEDGRAVTNTAYAVLQPADLHKFYSVQVTSGKVTTIGGFPRGMDVTDIAIRLAPGQPAQPAS